MNTELDERREWLEPDGLGGFASGTATGVRTRRYHALLLAAARPPADRWVLVNGLEVHVRTGAGTFALSSHRYLPDVVHPDGVRRLTAFEAEPWPSWTFALEDGTRIRHEVLVPHDRAAALAFWKVEEASGPVELSVRPLLSGRDPHALHRENPAFRFEHEILADGAVRWRPYDGLPAVTARTAFEYEPRPDWWRSFVYAEERRRGLDYVEDLASPGIFHLRLGRGEEASIAFEAEGVAPATAGPPDAQALRVAERARREGFASAVERAADAYIVRRDRGLTIVAGYPWFGDWGRDSFIALRGLCLATGRLSDAGKILEEWAGFVSEGMLPNRLPERGQTPEYNSVDATLWYAIAVHEYLAAATAAGKPVARRQASTLREAVASTLDGFERGTRHGIHVDDDGLLAAGEPGVQLTWMDAKVGDWVVTPRIGKPVEVQALWLNVLATAARRDRRRAVQFARGSAAFERRFWCEEHGYLYDVVDVDHVSGRVDSSLRPNQIFAVGGLPHTLVSGERARHVVDLVEERLWTPLGPRSLAPGSPGYAPRYAGGVLERDGAYHQGTVWPWLAGPFVEAWVRVRGGGAGVRREAARRFLAPLEEHRRSAAGIGHISEIADAEPPHAPGGCPFQAWSLGEYLRVSRGLLADADEPKPRLPRRHPKARRRKPCNTTRP